MASNGLPPGFTLDPAPADSASAPEAGKPLAIRIVVPANKGETPPPASNVISAGADSGLPPGFTLDTPLPQPQADAQAADLQKNAELQNNYLAALQRVHQNEYPQMSPEQFSQYASHALAPYSFTDEAQNAGLGGFGDEISSALGAVGNQARNLTQVFQPHPASSDPNVNTDPNFGQSFTDLQALEDARQKLGKANLGGFATAADILGGLSSFGKASAPNPAAIAQPLWQLMAKSLGVGSAVGAVEGAGSENDNRLGGAITGGVGGAVAGAMAPVIGHAVGAGVGKVADWLGSNAAARAAGISPEAAHVLSSTMAADGSLGPQGASRMAQAGHEAMLADAGPAAQQVLDTAIQKSGPAGALANLRIGARVTRDSRAVKAALDTHLGPPSGVETLRNTIRASTASARHAAYEGGAYKAAIDYSNASGRRLEELLGRVRSGDISAANTMMKEEGKASQQILASIDAKGNVTFKRMPDVRQIDYLTRALNDRAEMTDAKGGLGGNTTAGRITQNLSNAIRDALKENVPAYANALATAADPIRRSQAVVFGSKLLSRSVMTDQVANQVASMTMKERQAVAQGIRSRIEATMSGVSKALTDNNSDAREAIQALKDLSRRDNREKVALVIGQGRAQALFTEIDRATKSFELRAAMATNTKTFTRINMDKAIAGATAGEGPIGKLAKGEGLNAAKHGVQILTGMTPSAISKRQDELYREIVDILTSPAAKGSKVMQSLAQLRQAMTRGSQQANGVISRANTLALPASGIAGAQSSQVAQ
jgi:hypothetical protein